MAAFDNRNIDANAVVVGPHGVGGVLQSVGMTNGKVLIGKTGYPPVAASVGSSDGSVVITPGPGSIDISVSASIRDKAIASADHTVTVTSGPTTVDLSVHATSPDSTITIGTGPSALTLQVNATSDGSVAIVAGPSSLGLSVARPYNYLFNADVEIWGSGTAAAPTGWTLASGSVAKSTAQVRHGTASAALTRAGTDAVLQQNVLPIYPPAAAWASLPVTFGCWVLATVANRALLSVGDGVSLNASSAFHSGGGAWEFLTATGTVSSAPLILTAFCAVQNGNTTAYFDGAILVIGRAVSGWVPSGWRGRKAILPFSVGASTLTVNPSYYGLGRADTNTFLADYLRVPFKGVARNLRVNTDGGTFCTDTLMNMTGPTATALTVTFTGGITADDIAHEVELNPNDGYVMRSTEAAGLRHTATLELEEIP